MMTMVTAMIMMRISNVTTTPTATPMLLLLADPDPGMGERRNRSVHCTTCVHLGRDVW